MTSSATASVHNRECFEAFQDLPDSSIDSVITDPPYFLDRLADNWDVDKMGEVTSSSTVTSLPRGMKFDPEQGRNFQAFMGDIAKECLRVLKPGGFLLSFSAPRLYHRLGVAVEDAGFEVRDMWSWLYTQNQMKAMSVARFLKEDAVSPQRAAYLRSELADWKTPQVKSCLEPIVLAQKPKTDADGNPLTYLENWLEHGVGLINVHTQVGSSGDMATANVITTEPISGNVDQAFLVPKPTKKEKGDTTSHISVKPLSLMDQLIRATTPANGTVLDPFNGSGSTGVSALSLGRNYIGFELSPEYFEQSRQRFRDAFQSDGFTVSRGKSVFHVRAKVR